MLPENRVAPAARSLDKLSAVAPGELWRASRDDNYLEIESPTPCHSERSRGISIWAPRSECRTSNESSSTYPSAKCEAEFTCLSADQAPYSLTTVNYFFKQAHICDPSRGIDGRADLCIENGLLTLAAEPTADHVVMDGTDLLITPGFVDIHVHFREPGGEDSETIATGSLAAARGGFTHVVTMPNTTPPTDSPEVIEATIEKAKREGNVHVCPSACATLGSKGRELAPLPALIDAGAICFTDDGAAIRDADLMRDVLKTATELGVTVMQHAVDPEISKLGVIRECALATKLGLQTFDPRAESSIVERDIGLVRETGGSLHIQHLSSLDTLPALRKAIADGLAVTSEVTPHHLALSVDDIPGDDPNFKMNPPLGTAADCEALAAALADGTITCLATDHAPHTAAKKSMGLAESAFGIIGLETAAAITYDLLVTSGRITLARWVELWTTSPAKIIGIAQPSLTPGMPANLSVFQTEVTKVLSETDILSKSANTPFLGRSVSLDPILTFCDGRISWDSSDG